MSDFVTLNIAYFNSLVQMLGGNPLAEELPQRVVNIPDGLDIVEVKVPSGLYKRIMMFGERRK